MPCTILFTQAARKMTAKQFPSSFRFTSKAQLTLGKIQQHHQLNCWWHLQVLSAQLHNLTPHHSPEHQQNKPVKPVQRRNHSPCSIASMCYRAPYVSGWASQNHPLCGLQAWDALPALYFSQSSRCHSILLSDKQEELPGAQQLPAHLAASELRVAAGMSGIYIKM